MERGDWSAPRKLCGVLVCERDERDEEYEIARTRDQRKIVDCVGLSAYAERGRPIKWLLAVFWEFVGLDFLIVSFLLAVFEVEKNCGT